MLRICVAGATGRVGRVLVEAIAKADDMNLVGAVATKSVGRNLGQVLGMDGLDLTIAGSVAQALATPTDVFIDYTRADLIRDHTLTAIERGVHVVVGTSGLSEEDYTDIDALARRRGVGVFSAGNFAITAVLQQRFATVAARYVPSWEIVDFGYAHKVDAPSGTTRELAHRLAETGGSVIERPLEKTVGLREARGALLEGTPVHSVRLPGFISSVEIIFGARGERLSLRHEAVDDAVPYVAGTLLAVRKVPSLTGLVRGLDQIMDFGG